MKHVLFTVGYLVCLVASMHSQRLTWPMMNGDAQHTSYAEMSLILPLKVSQEFDVGFNSEDGMAITEDYIFIQNAADSNELIAVDRLTGDSLWMFGITGSGGSANFAPAAADGIVLAGGQGGDGIWGIDQESGLVEWFIPAGTQYTRCPAISDGKAFINGRTRLICADLQTGQEIWTFDNTIPQISPVCDDDNVYVGSGGKMYALDQDSGSEVWSADVPNGMFSSYAIDGELLFVGEFLSGISALNTTDGTVEWQVELDTNEILVDYPGAFSVSPQYLVVKYFINGSDRSYYLVLDKNTGSELSRFEGGSKAFCAPTAIGDATSDMEYILELANGDLALYALPAGDVAYQLEVPNTGVSPQVVVADNKIYFGANGPSIRIIETAGLSTRQANDELQLNIFPNPAEDYINIEIELRESQIEVMEVLSADGRVLMTTPITEFQAGNNTYRLFVGELVAGQYFLSIQTTKGSRTKSFMVN